ncbi:MAG: CinA family protein [Burkholderiales bacterium]|nr:CinA family protein [Burkholderiales bacterium]
MMPDKVLYELAAKLGAALKAQGLMLATAESCTGGWVAQAVTAVPGSSQWFERGFVTYTYISKREMLGVSQDTLGAHGAVSEPVVREMVAGALANSHAQVAVAVSGTAGPGGGTPQKPVGTVCLAWGVKNGEPRSATLHISGDREAVRRAAVQAALEGVLKLLPATVSENN